jgi:hypothetical protein
MAAPTITSVLPAIGYLPGGRLVSIVGTGLDTVTAVTFGATAGAIVSQTATLLVCTNPTKTAAGAVDVVATNPDGSATSAGGFTYLDDWIGGSLEAVERLLCNCATFRTLMGAASVAAARDKCVWQITRKQTASPFAYLLLMEGGSFSERGNREFQQWSPQFPETSIDSFITTNLRSIGSGLNTSYHNLANDLTSVNFSSIRQGALDEREVWKGLQNSFRDGVVIPMFEAWLQVALLNQIITINGKPLRFERIEKYKSVSFIGRRWSWIDPAAEQTANERAVAQGFKSRSMVIRETSDMDATDIWDEIAQDNEELAKRNIVPLIPSGSVPPQDAVPDGAAVQKPEATKA